MLLKIFLIYYTIHYNKKNINKIYVRSKMLLTNAQRIIFKHQSLSTFLIVI